MQQWQSHNVSRDLWVSPAGSNSADGSRARPLRTIQYAAEQARPGDRVLVQSGVYREWIDPPRGGISEYRPIVFEAAEGNDVVLTGSEPAEGWEHVAADTWGIELPATLFGDFNPFAERFGGEWYETPEDGWDRHRGAVYFRGAWFAEAPDCETVLEPAGAHWLWHAQVFPDRTTIYAQFPSVDPNQENVEISVRPCLFYPRQPGVNFITLRGFTLQHAATPWAGAMSEQMGLVGTHWSRSWVIEDNLIQYSMGAGITLGRYAADWESLPSVEGDDEADVFTQSVRKALANGWAPDRVGHHVVRRNHIRHCEKNGVHGSLGGAFSIIESNHIHDIAVRDWLGGFDMAGIKLLGGIDAQVRNNHVHHCRRGVWMDWMSQGSRVSANLCHDNRQDDFYTEVNHGPYLVDYNLFLSKVSMRNVSEGGAFVHNLFGGKLTIVSQGTRATPYQFPHDTAIAGVAVILGGDDRYLNNLVVQPQALAAMRGENRQFVGDGLGPDQVRPNTLQGNHLCSPEQLSLRREQDRWIIALSAEAVGETAVKPITAAQLGRAAVTGLPFEDPRGNPPALRRDLAGNTPDQPSIRPGPLFAMGHDPLHASWPTLHANPRDIGG